MEEKTENKTTTKTTTTWTTWEELLLACAVKRHGFKDWDTVSMEIQSRNTSLPHIFTTPNHCKLKYLDLKRRFNLLNDDDDVSHTTTDDGTTTTTTVVDDAVPWLDELKNLRVAELRQEVHRYDVSILSLQLKVKRLEDEREQSLKPSGDDDEKPDLRNITKEHGSENDKQERQGEPQINSPERVAGKSVSDEESDRENQSVNESNSTGPGKDEIQKTGLESAEDKAHEPEKSGSKKPDPVSSQSKPGGEDSCNESSDSIAKGLTNKGDRDSSELRDWVSESKRKVKVGGGGGGGEGTKESSDLQSSASLTRRDRRESGGAGETETTSAAIKQISVKSQPLVSVLELIRSHKRGSLFERRLESQESEKYNNVVRQHMDLQTMQKRLEQGSYSFCTSKFYRDLLLLFNNAIVFFPKTSVESVAASELRNLVTSEMSKQSQRSDSSPEPSLSPPPIQAQPKPEPERPESLLAKQKSSVPIIVCRKRSSISSKAAAAAVMSSRKSDQQSEEKKPAVDVKPPSAKSPTHLVQEQSLMKTDTKDKVVTGTRSLRRSNTNIKYSVAAPKNKSTSPASDKKETPKTEKNNKKEKEREREREKEIPASTKKRGAADFLKRIKGNSPLEKSKSPANDSKSTRQNNGSGGGGGENKRKRILKKDERKDRVVLRPKQTTKEEISPSKRSVGRPPKKAADPVPVKRRREAEASTSKRPKKRSRR